MGDITITKRELEALKLIAEEIKPTRSELIKSSMAAAIDAWITLNAIIDRAETVMTTTAIPVELSSRTTLRMRRVTPSCDCSVRDKPGEIHDLGCAALG